MLTLIRCTLLLMRLALTVPAAFIFQLEVQFLSAANWMFIRG